LTHRVGPKKDSFCWVFGLWINKFIFVFCSL